MPRARTGTLVYRRATGWNARIWVDVRDAATGEVKQERRWIPLATHDKDLAKRKVAKLIAMLDAGELVADAIEREATKRETFAEYAKAWGEARKTLGVVMAPDEIAYLATYVTPEIGPYALSEIRPVHVRSVLASAVKAGLQRESVRKIRGVLGRVLEVRGRPSSSRRIRSTEWTFRTMRRRTSVLGLS